MTTAEIVREARPPRRARAAALVKSLALYPLTVWRHREVLRNFYGRELRARFRGTLLGFAWPFVHPLVLFLVYYFVFGELLGAKFGKIEMKGLTPEQQDLVSKQLFTTYLFVGVIVWASFAESVIRNAGVILENANLIKKISFPSELLPLNVVLASLTIEALALGAYLAIGPFFGWNAISWRLLSLPVLFAVHALFSLGLSLAMAACNVFIRDTTPILGIVLTLWQFLTPVFWFPAAIPGIERFEWVMKWNPMYHLLEGYRRALVYPGLPQYRDADARLTIPDFGWPWTQCAWVGASGLAVFLVGYGIFLLSKPKFADEL